MANRWQPIREFAGRGIIALTLVTLLIPLLGPREKLETKEKRRPALLPSFPRTPYQYVAFPSAYEDYFKDHFAFRNSLVALHHRLKRDLLGESPNPNTALSTSGWLFLLGDEASTYQRLPGFDNKQLNGLTFMLTARQNWLANRGAKFLFFAAPNKHSIYPEELPPSARPLWETSPLDQLYAALSERGAVEHVDLRPALIQAKSEQIVYHKLDTHWNDVGCYIAYRALVEKLATIADFGPPMPLESFTRVERISTTGDLAVLAGLEGQIRDPQTYLEPINPASIPTRQKLNVSGPGVPEEQAYVAYETPGKSLKVLFLRDSFGDRMAPLIATHCARLVCGPSRIFNTALIEKEKPDIVLLERAERYLALPPEETKGSVLAEVELTAIAEWDFSETSTNPWTFPGGDPVRITDGIRFTIEKTAPVAVLANTLNTADSIIAVESDVYVTDARTGEPVSSEIRLFWATSSQVQQAAGKWPFPEEQGVRLAPSTTGSTVFRAQTGAHPLWPGPLGAVSLSVKLPAKRTGPFHVTLKRFRFLGLP